MLAIIRSILALPAAATAALISYLIVGTCINFLSSFTMTESLGELIIWHGETVASCFLGCMFIWALYLVAPKTGGRIPLLIMIVEIVLFIGSALSGVAVEVAIQLPTRFFIGLATGAVLGLCYVAKDIKSGAKHPVVTHGVN